jgi:hypothetical protein
MVYFFVDNLLFFSWSLFQSRLHQIKILSLCYSGIHLQLLGNKHFEAIISS